MIRSVVLADDSLEHCFFFKKALKEAAPHIKFAEVHNGEELMTLLENYLPDLLFLDLSMPCKNGVECIKEIRDKRVYDSMPIIVFSASSDDHIIQSAYGYGANLYLVKPEEFSSLKMTLRLVLSMQWNDPKLITEKFFHENKYVPFINNYYSP